MFVNRKTPDGYQVDGKGCGCSNRLAGTFHGALFCV